MRSPRKNTTTRARGPVTTSQARPEDIARLLAAKRATRKVYDTTVFETRVASLSSRSWTARPAPCLR
jgi:hypothetical protein